MAHALAGRFSGQGKTHYEHGRLHPLPQRTICGFACMTDHGYQRAGACADIFVFAPERPETEVRYAEREESLTAMVALFVNGKPALPDGEMQETAHGRLSGRDMREGFCS